MKTHTQTASGKVINLGAIIYIRSKNRVKARILHAIESDETLVVKTLSGLTTSRISVKDVHSFINPIL